MLFFFCLFSIIGILLAATQDEKYTTKYDNVDIDSIIRSERLTDNYVKCLLDLKPCPPEAAELKKNLPDGLEHECSSCSESQKIAVDKISHYLIEKKPEDWTLLEEKYDPTGAYRSRYRALIESDRTESTMV